VRIILVGHLPLRGRGVSMTFEIKGRSRLAVKTDPVNEMFARRYFPGRNPLDERLKVGVGRLRNRGRGRRRVASWTGSGSVAGDLYLIFAKNCC
jgi:hypothetical protein